MYGLEELFELVDEELGKNETAIAEMVAVDVSGGLMILLSGANRTCLTWLDIEGSYKCRSG